MNSNSLSHLTINPWFSISINPEFISCEDEYHTSTAGLTPTFKSLLLLKLNSCDEVKACGIFG